MDAADKAPRRFGSRYIPESGDVPPGSSAQKSPQTGIFLKMQKNFAFV